MATPLPDYISSDTLELQLDECDAIAAILTDDVTVHSKPSPISYSINIRPTHEEVEDASLWPRDEKLALKVTYTDNYPDETPTFNLVYSRGQPSLHPLQEDALMRHINTVAELELGTPCILSCLYAARDFFNSFGLVQAALSMLKDDCLAYILSYLASSKVDVDLAVSALPLFKGVYKTDIVWKEICQSRWREKWGFSRRWKRALDDFNNFQYKSGTSKTSELHQSQFFWLRRYDTEECDSSRRVITRDELCSYTFEVRRWFSQNALDVRSLECILTSGLNQHGKNVQFTFAGEFLGYSKNVRKYSLGGANPLKPQSIAVSSMDSFTVLRTTDWGWQLNSYNYVMRSVDDIGDKFASPELLWKDLNENLVMEQRPPEVVSRFNWREIPDDEELQSILPWRNSWRTAVD